MTYTRTGRPDLDQLLTLAETAADGDSNDEEIQALVDALEAALALVPTDPPPPPVTTYLLAWTGGLEEPQFQATTSYEDAYLVLRELVEEVKPGDRVDLLALTPQMGQPVEVTPLTLDDYEPSDLCGLCGVRRAAAGHTACNHCAG